MQARLRDAREAGDEEAEARLSGVLARALAARGIEAREVLRLGERAFALGGDGALASDLSSWWASVGEPARAAAILQRVEGRASPEDRGAVRTRIGVLLARAGKAEEAAQAFESALQAATHDPLPAELLGTLRGWGAIRGERAARAFTEAAARRAAAGDVTGAFENSVRAFEACPSDPAAAEQLALALEERGRPGAAEEVLREQARSGSAARRAAIHQRRFGRLIAEQDWSAALGAALDAELDAAFDAERLAEVLAGSRAEPPRDVESLFVHLAAGEPVLVDWLLAALDAAVFAWGASTVQGLRARLLELYPRPEARAQLAPELALGEEEILRRIAALREQLVHLGDASQEGVRLELARLQGARGDWFAAQEVLQPLLAPRPGPSLEAACLGAVTALRAGMNEGRALALWHVAGHAQGRVRAVVASVAAELLLDAGQLAEARLAAEMAVDADPSWQRGVAAQALVAQRDPDSAAAVLLERSLAVVLARGSTCQVLADSSERRGALRLALTWTQRQLAQRPGDPEVAKELLRRAAEAGDGERLADALSWLLSQPIPLARLVGPAASALGALARLAPERAPEVARRVLDVLGPRVEAVREAVLEVARTCQVPDLEAQVLERWLVTASPQVRAGALVELARLRAATGETAAAARALGRALAAGASATVIAERLEALPPADEGDALLAVLEAQVEVLQPASGVRGGTGAGASCARWLRAVRELGAARWDLAGDVHGAVLAWVRRLEWGGAEAVEELAWDLHTFGGPEMAARELERVAEDAATPATAGRLLGLAARFALEAQRPADAFRLAREALTKHPANADVLTIAESAATSQDVDELVALYRTLAQATLGRYGERAVHYRAARQLERRGHHDVALQHAVAAFEAVPGEGVAFVLMARLADRAGDSDQVVGALERVASRTPDDGARVLWLARAAALADTSESGRRQRIDVLLRAVAVRPDAPTLGTLAEAMRQLLEVCPDDAEVVHLRFERALGVLLPKAGGMEGSAFAVRAAIAALELFGDDQLALRALQRAAECDSDIEQFAELRPYAERLAALGAPARAFVAWCVERAGNRLASCGRALAELAATIAHGLGEKEAHGRLLIRAAVESPHDTALVGLAQTFARELGDPELLATVEGILPADDRARQILAQAADSSVDVALDLLLEVELDPLSPEVQRQLYEALAQRQEEIGRLDDAEDSYRALLARDPVNRGALEGLERAAERRGDHEELARLLLRRAECATDAAEALQLRLRRATLLERSVGRVEEARQELERLLSEEGEHPDLLHVLADLHRRSGSPSRAATLWGRARAVSTDPEQQRELTLLAAEAHLEAGQVDGARRTLEQVTFESTSRRLLELRVKLARQSGDRGALVRALSELAKEERAEPAQAAALLVEAATTAEAGGDAERALELAVQAAELTPQSAEAQLLARRLEYLARGAGNLEQAQRTVAQLRNLQERLNHRQIELRAFLLAEALDVTEGGAAGLRELDRAVERVGSRALVAVGLAERLDDDPRRALQLLDAALGSDLHGLRGEGQVLIRAGRVARSLGELDRAQAYLSAVAHDDPRQVEAAAELREIAAERGRAERDNQARAEREARARAEREAAEREARARAEREAAEREARARAEREAAEREAKARAEREAAEREARARAEREAAEREAAEREARARAEREAAEREASARAEREAAEREAAERAAKARAEREAAERDLVERAEQARAREEAAGASPISTSAPPSSGGRRSSNSKLLVAPPASPREQELRAAFEHGDPEAARGLLELLGSDPARAQDRLLVAERLTLLQPGDEWALRQFAAAAEVERNGPLAAAIRHVLGTFGVIPFEVAPEVGRLREQPDLLRRVLASGLQCAGTEATALVWEHATNLFKQEPSTYGITGLERVAAGPLTPLSRLYADAGRLLGASRTPVFQRRGTNSITLSVALLVPPALLVTGEIEESSAELAFHFGAMLMATSPELALLFGAPPANVRTLLAALRAAFGPPSTERPSGEVTRLATALWEALPPRKQRRLSQLCADPAELAYEKVTAVARQVLRRAGLVLCADLATAVVAACEEERLAPPRTLAELGVRCRQSAAVADLVRLALSPEYAEVRWNAS